MPNRYRLENGQIVDVKAKDLGNFLRNHQNATILYRGISTWKNEDGKIVNVEEDGLNNFVKDNPKSKLLIGNKDLINWSKQNDLEARGITKENASFFSNPWDWFWIGDDETQEKDTWLEMLLTKNQITDFFGDRYRDVKRGYVMGTNITEMGLIHQLADEGEKLSEEQLEKVFKSMQELNEIGQSDEMLKYMQGLESSGNKTWDFITGVGGIITQPELAIETFLTSLTSAFFGMGEKEGWAWGAPMALAGGTGAAATSLIITNAGPQALSVVEDLPAAAGSFVLGGLGGLVSGIGGSIEMAGKINESISKAVLEKYDEFTYENFKKLFEEHPDSIKDIYHDAYAKGMTIGVVDTIFSAIAPGMGKVLTSSALRTGGKFARTMTKPLVRTGVIATTEGTGGAFGEYLSQRVIGEEASGKELALEFTGGGPVTAVSMVRQIANPGEYGINGKPVTRDQMWDYLSDPNISDADIVKSVTVKNDEVLQSEYKSRVKAVKYLAKLPKDTRKQIDNPDFDSSKPESKDNPRKIENPNYNKDIISLEDRKLLLDLERKLEEAEGKKAALVEVGGKLISIADLKQQIKNVYSKYEGKTEGLRTGDVKTAVDIRKAIMKDEQTTRSAQEEAGLDYQAYDFTEEYEDAYFQKYLSSNKIDITKMTDDAISKLRDKVLYGNEKFSLGGAEGVRFDDGTILIDRQRAVEVDAYDRVNSHEFLHNLVDDRFKNLLSKDREKGLKLISDFRKILKSKLSKKDYNKILKRLKKEYKFSEKDLKETTEWFTVFSDLVKEKKGIKERKGLFQTLVGFFNKNVNEHTEYKNLDFESAENMFEWIKTYSTDIKGAKKIKAKVGEGKEVSFSRSQAVDAVNNIEKTLKEKLLQQNKKYTQEEFRKSKEFGELFDSINNDGGAINSYIKSLEMSKEKTEKTIRETAMRLMNYNPQAERKTGSKEDITIGERIMSDIGFAKLDAAKKLAIEGKKEGKTKRIDATKRTKEGETTFDVEDTGVDVEAEKRETEDISPQAEARRKKEAKEPKVRKTSKLRKTLGIETGSEIYNRVLDTARKVLIRAYDTGKTVRNVQIALKKEANTYIFKQVKNMLGVAAKYIPTIKTLRQDIVNSMFTSDLVQMERNVPDNEKVFTRLVKKLTKVEEVEAAVEQNLLPVSDINRIKKGQSVNLYEKVMPTEEQFVSFFDKPLINPETGARSGLRGTRKDQLTTYLANSLTLDAIMQVAQEPDVAEKRQMIAELKGEAIDNADIQILSTVISRDPNVQFSVTEDGTKIGDGDANIIAHVTNIFNKILENKSIKGIITVDEENNKIYLNKEITRIYGRGPNKMSPKSQDFVARLVYQMYNDNRYARPSSSSYRDSLIGRLVELKQEGKNGNFGIAEQVEVENLLKSVFGKTFEFLKGTGDIYAAIKSYIFGFEVKLGESQGVSQRVRNTKNGLVFPNKNKTKNEKGKLFDDVIGDKILLVRDLVNNFLEMNGFGSKENPLVEDFSKPLTQEQIDILYPFRFLFQVKEFVNDKYITSAYAQEDGYHGNTPQGMMISERDVYYMETGNEKVDKLHGDFVKIFNLNPENTNKIPKLELIDGKQIEVIVNFEIDENGFMSHRIRPQLIKKDFKKSSVNINDANVAKNIGIALQQAASLQFSNSFSRSVENARPSVQYSKTSRGMSTFDFDETLIDKGKNFIIAKKGDKTIKITSEQWPIEGPKLTEQGYSFDFKDFVNVRGGIEGPLLQKLKNRIKKFGPENNYILTARPPESATAIHGWLKSKGINIPLKNITGLGDSTGQAKALWMLDKFAEGYNDMYFVDDALPNVKAVKNILDQLDVKSNVQQTRVQFSKTMNSDFNSILEDISGIDAKKRYSDAKARRRGRGKGMFRFFIPPSHEDFLGLLYNFMGKGKKGNQHRDFFERTLIKPLNRAFRELNQAKQAVANDYRALIKGMPEVRKKLSKKILDGDFTTEDAIRVYLWDRFGFEIPGLSKKDQSSLVEFIKSNLDLQSFADTLSSISRVKEGYTTPGDSWEVGNIRYDLVDATGRVGRAKFFTEFVENADIIFSSENINKIRAIFGDNFIDALNDMLYAVKTGTNRPSSKNKQVNAWLDWINGSVGATMFFNARSALLQQLSFVNFINFADNNIFKAAAAFANQPQFWKDFARIFNSDFLKQRRSGAAFDVNANEIAREVAGSKNPVRAAIKYILNLGFLPTQMGDSFAIAIGGASFLRNRINTYLKQGFSQAEAESKAFDDFAEVAEATQQSARPDMVSMQQRSPFGRLILAFQNVSSQYARLIKKSGLDLAKRRISKGYTTQAQSDAANVSKIIYYGAVQGMVFYGLQNALFAMMFDDDERDEDFFDKKKDRVVNGLIDNILKGSGVAGSVVATIKNYVWKLVDNQKSDAWFKSPAWEELLQVSPPLGIKIRKIKQAERTLDWNKDVIKEMPLFTLDNPIWELSTAWVEGFTNVPLNRLHTKVQNVKAGLDSENAWWQRIAVLAGWSKWNVGIENTALEEAKQRVKDNKKQINKETKLKKATPEEKIKIVEKSVFDLNKREQVKILEANNLNSNKYPKEADRVDAIMNLRSKNQRKIDSTINAIENYIPTEKEQREIDLFKMNKLQQVDILIDLGASPKLIKTLKYEKDRVLKIIQLENKKKSKKQ